MQIRQILVLAHYKLVHMEFEMCRTIGCQQSVFVYYVSCGHVHNHIHLLPATIFDILCSNGRRFYLLINASTFARTEYNALHDLCLVRGFSGLSVWMKTGNDV